MCLVVQVMYRAADNVKFAVLKELSLTYKLLSMAWISCRTVVFVDVSEQAHVVDVRTAEELEVVDLTGVGLAYSTSLCRRSVQGSSGGGVGRAMSRVCCETVAVSGGQLVLLGLAGVHVFSVRTWFERLNVLVRRRRFADALSLSRSFYARLTTTSPGDDSAAASAGRLRRRDALTERVLELLAKYLDHVDTVSSLYTEDSSNNDAYHVRLYFFI